MNGGYPARGTPVSGGHRGFTPPLHGLCVFQIWMGSIPLILGYEEFVTKSTNLGCIDDMLFVVQDIVLVSSWSIAGHLVGDHYITSLPAV